MYERRAVGEEGQGLSAICRDEPDARGFGGVGVDYRSADVEGGRSEMKAIHLPSGLHSGFSSVPDWVSGLRPDFAVQSQRL